MVRTDDAAAETAALLRRYGRAEKAEAIDGRIEVRFPGGHETDFSVESVTTAMPDHGRHTALGPAFVVADRIPERVRRVFEAEDVSWWDRRGHLRVVAGPVLIDADVPPETLVRASAAVDPLAGAVVAGVSITALAMFPQPIPGVRALARRLDASPGGVSLAAQRLIDAGLLTLDRVAARPGLFWAVSDRWRPDWTTIEGAPPPDDRLVAVGSRAAANLGAPISVTSGAPVELLAADRATYRRAIRNATGGRPTRIALGPSPAFSTIEGPSPSVDGYRAAHPVVVAALLGADAGRGAEIIADWEMDDRAW